MANTVEVIVQKEHLHENDIEHLEDKLTIYFQRLKTGCDVDILGHQDTDEAVLFLFQFTEQKQRETSSGKKEIKEKEGKCISSLRLFLKDMKEKTFAVCVDFLLFIIHLVFSRLG